MDKRQRSATEPTIPRIASNLRPLLTEVPSLTDLTIRTPPTPTHGSPTPRPQHPLQTSATAFRATHPLQIDIPPQQQPTPPRRCAWCGHTAITWALRFSIHLLLISVFETLFFWLYVSQSEDRALISLVNTYMTGVLDNCATMTPAQRAETSAIIGALINVTTVNSEGAVAAATRTAYNNILFRNSWLYVSALFTLCVVLGCAPCHSRPLPWRTLILENLALVSLLGLYEWMFFHTVALRYRAITTAELDRMVVDELTNNC
jgi:hypothetical protein